VEDVEIWKAEQLAEIEALQDDAKKWQTELKKEARSWHDATLREFYGWQSDIENEIEMMKEEARYGYKGTAGESAGSEDLLGSSTGESDQAETDDSSGRKRRSSSSGAN
jgi:hypothetical protein